MKADVAHLSTIHRLARETGRFLGAFLGARGRNDRHDGSGIDMDGTDCRRTGREQRCGGRR
jgi:hypothetical protein